ncbi:ABC transporter permease [Nocardioides ferulae]|uniref:ABC transporter permease n=1 Tax=Nocardioides ferulae TaxID=2340821 RepID=UPI000EADE591|nr:ABC transporter permease [Nocardioides ferulae]
MFAYIVKRLLAGFLVVTLISMMVYALFWYGPRSPAQELCRRESNNRCTPEKLERYEEALGYNNSVTSEYGKWAKGLVAGRDITVGASVIHCEAPCLGLSYRTRQPVFEEMKTRLPATISLAVGAASITLTIGVTVGVLAARRRGTFADKALVSTTLFMSSIPYYLFALLSMLYLTIVYDVFPQTGYTPLTDNPGAWFTGLLLPWLALGFYNSTSYTRFSRGAMVESLSEDYIRTARAKGLTSRVVVMRHALRAALVPVVTIFGIDFAFLLAGTIFTEKIFDIQGIGRWGLDATLIKDLPVVQATVLFGSIIIVVANIIVDIIYSILDPRVRLS